MGYEKDSASRDLDLEQAPLEVIKVDGQESRIVAFFLRLAEWLIRLSIAGYSWGFLVIVWDNSASYPNSRTASRLTVSQIQEGKRMFTAEWYYLEVTPAYNGIWIPRSLIWAGVALVTFGWYRNKPLLRLGRGICLMFFVVFSLLNLCSR